MLSSEWFQRNTAYDSGLCIHYSAETMIFRELFACFKLSVVFSFSFLLVIQVSYPKMYIREVIILHNNFFCTINDKKRKFVR